MDAALPVPVLAASLLVAAAASDMVRYTIPNWICLAVAALFPVHLLLTAASLPPIQVLAGHPLAAVGILACGAILFALGAMGGGDVKLLAATALWAGPAGLPTLLLVMALAGGLLALLWPAGRLLFGPRSGSATLARLQLPYGVAIAIGGLAVLPLAPGLSAAGV